MWSDSLLIVFISICTALLGEGLTWILVYRTEKYQKLKVEVERQSKKLEKRKEAHGDSLDKQHKKKIEREEERLKNNNRDLSLVKMKSMFAIGFAFTALLSMFNSIYRQRQQTQINWVNGGKDDSQLVYFNVRHTLSLLHEIPDVPLTDINLETTQTHSLNTRLIAVTGRFDGRVVAKLPFYPISWLQGLSHRNLPGDDYTDCSFIFLYILCTMSIRQNIQKLLGFAPSRAASKQGGALFGAPPAQFK